MANLIKQAFDFRFDPSIRKEAEDLQETKDVDFMLSRGKTKSPDQEGVEVGLRTTKKFVTPEAKRPEPKKDIRSSRSKTLLAGDQTRTDGSRKGPGFLGSIPAKDGKHATELSIGVNIDGKETLIPSLVPGLTKQEINWMVSGNKPTATIVDKAVQHARKRMSAGKSAFLEADETEQTMADDKPSKSKEVLGGKAAEPAAKAERRLNRMSLEKTSNGHVKATHRYDDGEEIHALAPNDFLGHLGQAFNLSNEKKSIDAKKSNVEAYEKEHGSLTKPAAAAPAAEPDQYDKIRANIREKAAKPSSESVSSLLDRANALITGK